MHSTKLARRLLLGTAALVFASTAASAQIEEVVVTAQKRSQDIQTVPIAVSAFSGESLKAAKIRDVQDLQLVSPSLLISTGSGETSGSLARIRGLGTTGNNIGLEAAVGVFIDGVYRNRTANAINDLVDVERVEVLRGPQGTLFGKNTTAGAISIVTRKPTFEPELEASVTGANLNGFLASGLVSGGIIEDKLAASLAASVNTRSGFVKDVDTGETFNDRKRWNVKGQLLFTPTSDIEFRLIGDYSEKNENCCQAVYVSYGRHNSLPVAPIQFVQELAALKGRTLATPYTGPKFPANVATLLAIKPLATIQDANFKNYRGSYNSPLQSDSKDWGFSGQLDWALGFGSLTSITAYREFTSDAVVDVDYSPADILGPAPSHVQTKFFSEEVQLKGKLEWLSGLDWLFGGYLSREIIEQNNSVIFGSQATEYFARLLAPAAGGQISNCIRGKPNAFPGCHTGPVFGPSKFAPFYQPGQGYTNAFNQTGTSWSVFTHETLHLTDKLSVTAGIRYNHEHKHGKFGSPFQSNTFGSCPSVPGTANDDGSGNVFLPLSLRLLCPRKPYQRGFNEDAITYTANVAYQWTDKLMTYASFSRGYKAGGFNLDRDSGTAGGVDLKTALGSDRVNPIRFKPETAESIESGIRSEWFDSRLIVNLTGFYTQFYNYQLNTFGGLGFTISNIGAVNSKGAEIEAVVAPVEGLVLTGGATYADAKYGRRVITPGFLAGAVGGTDGEGSCGLTPASFGGTTAAISGGPLCLQGRTLTQAPKWTISGSADYQHPLWDWGYIGFIDVNAQFRTQWNTGSNLDPRKVQDDLTIVNGRVGVRTDDGRYEVEFWGRNIFDRHYKIVAFDSVAQSGNFNVFPGEPVTFGGTVTVHFD